MKKKVQPKNRSLNIKPTGEILDINYVSNLANLKLTDAERKTFVLQLTDILNYFEQLRKLNTDGIEPIGHITGLENVTREDAPAPSLSQEEALKNAPKVHNGFIEVEAIFEEV